MSQLQFPQSRVRAGVARADITPPVGIYHRMWGAATHDRSTGVHRPLTATVLYLAPDDEHSSHRAKYILAVDHCLLWPAEMQTLLAAISSQADVPQQSLLVCFSHTHAAGLMGLERRDLPGGDLIPPYLDELAEQLTTLTMAARQVQEPATIVYAHGHSDLATNRDFWDSQRQRYVCGFNPTPQQPADSTVLAARITSDRERLLATIVNYACHPTTLAWQNTLISPDYPGAMREVIERATSAPCVFLQGASGDLGPREGFVGDPAVADRNGRQLGYAALAALENIPAPLHSYHYTGPVISGATLGCWQYEPVSAERRQALSRWNELTATVALRYRHDLPDRAALEREKAHWLSVQDAARADGNEQQFQDARAMVERATRRLVRCGQLPDGPEFPYEADVWRMGDAIWVALNGEHYSILQQKLRTAFPDHPLVITTLVNGSQVWYLPDAASYGKGLYQEEASILAAGSLEKLIEALQHTITQLTE